MNDLIPLNHLVTGERARVGQLLGVPEEVHRLQELGLRDGAPIEMVSSGSPCIIRLSETKLCFRNNDATSVLVYADRAS